MPLSLAWAWLSDTCLFEPWAGHWYCWRRASGLLHEGLFEEDVVLEKTEQSMDLFFFLHGNSLSFTSLLALFFYLRYHFFSTTVYTSLLCATSVKYNLRLLLYALILPVSPSFVPLRDPSETSLVFFAEPINLQPCSWETRVFSGSQPHMEMVVRIIFRKLTMFWNQNIFTYFPRSISDH